MKTLLRLFAIAAIVVLAAACNEKEQFINERGAADTRGIVNLGLPGGTDPVDGDGNVSVSRNLTLSYGNTYILHNYFRIQDGYTITIEAGVTIKGEKSGVSGSVAPGTLVIERGAQINAQGTASSPIVFTSNQTTKAPGDWGGVVILGKADVNVDENGGAQPSGTDGLGFIEGLPTPNNTGRYGNGDLTSGSYNSDNSGTMTYVRIEYAGHEIGEANELNALTLGGVGNGTTLNHIMVSYGLDDGYEFFGGCVNAKYLIANKIQDDDFDTDQGYFGKIQFGISRKTPGQSIVSSPVGGFESNGDSDDDEPTLGFPLTNATFSNFTVIGPVYPNSTSVLANYNSGALIRDESHLNIFNSIIAGYPVYQLELETPGDFDSDENSATDNEVSIEGVTLVYPTFSVFTAQCTNVTDFTSYGSYNNECKEASAAGTSTRYSTLVKQTGLYASTWWNTNPDILSFVAQTEKAADFSHDLLDGFFTVVDFRGAFGNSSDSNNADWNITSAWVEW